MFEGIGEALGNLIKLLFILCCISVPLAIWKLVEIIIWLFSHVSIEII